MRKDDKMLLYVIIALWVVQGIGILAPMRADWEQTIFLSLFPGLDATLGIMNLVAMYGNEPGKFIFMYLLSVAKDALIVWLGVRLSRHR